MHLVQGERNKESRLKTAGGSINRLVNTMDGQCISHTKKNLGLTGQRCLQESDKLWAENIAERCEKLINANPLKSSLTLG